MHKLIVVRCLSPTIYRQPIVMSQLSPTKFRKHNVARSHVVKFFLEMLAHFGNCEPASLHMIVSFLVCVSFLKQRLLYVSCWWRLYSAGLTDHHRHLHLSHWNWRPLISCSASIDFRNDFQNGYFPAMRLQFGVHDISRFVTSPALTNFFRHAADLYCCHANRVISIGSRDRSIVFYSFVSSNMDTRRTSASCSSELLIKFHCKGSKGITRTREMFTHFISRVECRLPILAYFGICA